MRVWARARVEGWLEVERVCLEAVRARARVRVRARVCDFVPISLR